MAYILAARSGNFSATSTWVGGVVPSAGDIACTLAYRITLDVDTDAHLSVSRTDWVAGGGTDSATITGGFTLPADATRVVGGDIRYDNGTTTIRNTSTTSPIYMTSGTLTVRNILWVSGTNAIVSGTPAFYVVNIATVSGKTSKFTYTGTATILYNTANSSGTYNVYSISVTGSGFVDLTFGEAVQVQATAGASSYCSMLLNLANNTGGYNLTLNGNIPTGSSVYNTGIIYINTTSTGVDNQKLTINSPTLGLCPVVATANNAAIHVATTNGVSSLSITPPKLSLHGYGQIVISASGYPCCAFGFTANSLETFYSGGISLSNAGSVTTGNIYINSLLASYASAALIFSGAGDVTLGDITLRAITSVLVSARAVKAVTLTGTGNITVGNISSEAGQLSEIGLLSINNASPLTKSVTVGNIDASNVYVRAPSNNNHPLAVHTHLVYIARQTTGTITVGNVIGANNGLNVASDVFALTLSGFAADNGTVTINGNVMAGNRMSAVLISSSAKPVVINGYIQGVSSILGTLINIPIGVVTYGVITCNAIKQAVKNCVAVFGQFYFNSYTNGVITLVDSSDNVYDLFTMAQTNQVIPAASDVRSGVLVGSTTGTLAVPPASSVLTGIPVDNTVGSLSLATELSTITTKLNAVESQTNQLTFVTATTEVPDPNNDPYWSSVVFASHCDSLTELDVKSHIVTNSSVALSSANKKFGDASWFFSGSSTGLSSTSADYTLGTSDFTVEFWFYQNTSTTVYQRLLQLGANSTAGGLWVVANQSNTTTTTPFIDGYTSTWTRLADASVTLSRNTWHHLALTRSGNTFKLYLNGTLASQSTYSYNATGSTLYIGHNGSYSDAFNGYIDDIRITKGVVRYSGNFTPSTSAFAGYNLIIVNGASSVLAYASVDMSDITPRFDTIDASLTTANTGITAANNAVAAVKAKTDQLTFGAGGVIAQTGSTDYTARFDTLETQVANIPTLTYTTSFAGINTKLDTLQATVSSGGVDLSPVTNALATVDSKVTGVKAKTDQLMFTTGGVVADVEVSVQAAIDYTEQFTEITSKLDSVQAVTGTFQFNANGVIASATVDMSGMVSRFDNLDIAIDALPVQSHTDAQYNTLFNQLNVIGNATGAIDLTPIMTSLSQIYTSVENVPRLTYSASFVNVNNKLDALATATADVDFTPVLNAIAAIPAPNLTTITTKLDNMQADVTTIKDAAVRIEVLSSGIRDKLSTATGVDLSGVEHQLSLLNSKFDGVDAPVQVVPTGNAGTTVLYAHCTHSDGTPVAGQSATLHIMQVVGEGVLLPDHTLTSTSGADGLISFVLPRDAGISAMFEYRGRKERVVLVGDATQALPSIVAKL